MGRRGLRVPEALQGTMCTARPPLALPLLKHHWSVPFLSKPRGGQGRLHAAVLQEHYVGPGEVRCREQLQQADRVNEVGHAVAVHSIWWSSDTPEITVQDQSSHGTEIWPSEFGVPAIVNCLRVWPKPLGDNMFRGTAGTDSIQSMSRSAAF